jgi:serine/threonine-protein kinase HipA
METEVHVYLHIARQAHLVGRLWARTRQGRETATFVYDPAWLRRRGAVALAPSLPLTPGPFHSDRGLFAAFSDAAPDRWGQKLMRHHERERAAAAGTDARTLGDIDFLLGVDDETRLGALRFKAPGSDVFLAQTGRAVPPLVELGKLLSASDRIEKGRERRGDLALLLAPGGSLGGVRPKAVVRDRFGTLNLAKFPWKNDDWSVILWEKVTLDLARAAGVDVPPYKLERVGNKSVLLVGRFDRRQVDMRLPFMSAMTALGARDRDEDHSYLEIVDALRQMGGAAQRDISQLWRRMVFNILVSNTDDHLRNHGLLLGPEGWRLAPAYDMNPCPMDVGGRVHVLAINERDRTGSLDLALSVADYFGLSQSEAKAIAAEVGTAVAQWSRLAAAQKIAKSEIDRLCSAFAHRDLDQALGKAQPPVRSRTPGRTGRASAREPGQRPVRA